MTDDERKLIADLFDRMHGMQGIDKEPDAARFIDDEMRANPDAGYLLTQSVLVQEQALQQAEARIRELEGQLAGRDPMPVGERSFAQPQRRVGVPSIGAARQSAGFAGGQARTENRTDGRAAPSSRFGAVSEGRSAPAAGRGASGGFMAQAMTTAAGVAGGMLLASGISSLFGSSTASAATPAPEAQPASNEANADPSDQAQGEPTLQDAAADDTLQHGDGGWGDWGDIGDIDI